MNWFWIHLGCEGATRVKVTALTGDGPYRLILEDPTMRVIEEFDTRSGALDRRDTLLNLLLARLTA